MRSRTVQGTVAIAATASLALAACGGAGGPQSGGSSKLTDDKVVIGLLNDQSGVYKDLSGPNSKVAIEMAIEDYKAKYGDKAVAKNIEIVQADHQNKADVANSKAQEMYDRQKADIILDVPNSAAALAVATQAKNKKKLYINIGAGTTALTGASCNKYTFHWAYNTAVLARGTAGTITEGRRHELEHRLPRLRLRPGHEQVVHRARSRPPAARSASRSPRRSPATTSPPSSPRPARATPRSSASMHAGGDLINFVKQFNQSSLKGKVAARRRPDVHHRHPLARGRPVRRHAVHRRVVLELRRRRTRSGPTASRRRRTPVRPSPTPPTTRPR